LFFFFNYEGHRQNVGQSVGRVVPSAMLQDGIFQYLCANPSSCPSGNNVTGASGTSYPIQPGYNALGPTELAQMDPLGIGPSPGALAYFKTYNLAAIPVAGGLLVRWGLDLPMSVGAVAMSLSTIIVAMNAQLLRRLNLRRAGVV